MESSLTLLAISFASANKEIETTRVDHLRGKDEDANKYSYDFVRSRI